MPARQPALIILGAPGTAPPPGSSKHRCMGCTELYPISPSSLRTLDDFKERRQFYVIVCYHCYGLLAKTGPHREVSEPMGIREARKRLGFDE